MGHRWRLQVEGQALVSSQVPAWRPRPGEWKPGWPLSVTRGSAQREPQAVGALSSYSPGGWRSHSGRCSAESLSESPDFWFGAFRTPPKGVPVAPHHLSLDVALDTTVAADRDSTPGCPWCPKSPRCSCCVQWCSDRTKDGSFDRDLCTWPCDGH